MVFKRSAQEAARRTGTMMICAFLAGMVILLAAACQPLHKNNEEPPPGAGQSFTNDLGMTFVYIRPGEFVMGSPDNEPERDDDEKQRRTVLSRGFYMQTTEVTQAQWKAVMGDNPSHFSECGDNCPVEQVSWNDVQAFIRRLNQRGGRACRLPAEAEWEYACRAGTTGTFNTGNCLSTDLANFDGMFYLAGCTEGRKKQSVMAVKSFPPNAWGLYDMHGNVWEWCADRASSYASANTAEFAGSSSRQERIFRGGGWSSGARGCRSAERNQRPPDFKSSIIGFRLVADP